jgi:peptide deformylase
MTTPENTPSVKVEGIESLPSVPQLKPLPSIFSIKTEVKAHAGSVQKVLHENDPLLKSISEPFDFSSPKFGHPVYIAQSLILSMKAYGGIGLAAVQIGWPIRVFAVGYENQTQVFFNPEIVATSIETEKAKEGCISFPFCFTLVERPTKVRVRFQNQEGEWKEEDYSGYTARVIQHEYDHLDGITLRDKVSKLYWKAIKQKAAGLYKKALKMEARKQK